MYLCPLDNLALNLWKISISAILAIVYYEQNVFIM
jgi:hypothetical protein